MRSAPPSRRERPIGTVVSLAAAAVVLALAGISQCNRPQRSVATHEPLPTIGYSIPTFPPYVPPTTTADTPAPVVLPSFDSLYLAIGHQAHAHSRSGGPIFAGVTLTDWLNYQKAIRAGDRDGVVLMAFRSQLVTIDEGAKVLVIDKSCEGGLFCTTIYRVRLLEGTLVGDAGWISSDFVGP